MKKIHKLPTSVISQIAAGEVVERPSSVLKEMIENSIDAGAQKIEVRVLEGGISLIEVSDDGNGVMEDDIENLIAHHATSKLKTVEDLSRIGTFGFRGEALSSIASVSKLTVSSKSEGEVGFEAHIEEGRILKTNPKPRSKNGTTIKVEELFRSIPARKKFLKSTRTEITHIYRVLEDFALSNPEIHFLLESNGVKTKEYLPSSPRNRVEDVWGKSIAENIIPIQYHGADIQIKGFITHPYTSFSRLKYNKIFVQNRSINSSLIHKALMDGYDTMLEVRKYPGYILKIQLNPESVDVNVHPRKMEVKFDDERSMYRVIRKLISESLQKQYITSVTKTEQEEVTSFNPPSQPQYMRTQSFKPHTSKQSFVFEKKDMSYQSQIPSVRNQKSFISETFHRETHQNQLYSENQSQMIAPPYQILDMYIVVLYKDRVDIIDQHAAHEKILLEKLFEKHVVHTQGLISPITIHVQNSQKELFFELTSALKGFVFRDFGPDSVILEAIPTFIMKKKEQFYQDIVDKLIADNEKFNPEDAASEFYKMVGCKAAVKAGDKLSVDEMNQLLIDLSKSKKAYACCHGRPTTREFTQKELDKLFSR